VDKEQIKVALRSQKVIALVTGTMS